MSSVAGLATIARRMISHPEVADYEDPATPVRDHRRDRVLVPGNEPRGRLADIVPPPRKHRHRYHGVFAPNHKLRKAVTALAIGNVGKQREAATGGHAGDDHAAGGCCDANQKPRSHDTSRIAWAKLLARVGEEFPLECPACGGDIRLIAFITEPGQTAGRKEGRKARPMALPPPLPDG